MRRQIIEDNVRVDGRKLDEVRPVSCQVDVLPKRVHGSGLFNRGLTQVLAAALWVHQAMPKTSMMTCKQTNTNVTCIITTSRRSRLGKLSRCVRPEDVKSVMEL